MKFDVEETNEFTRKVTFETSKEDVNLSFQQIYRELGQHVRLKGFRKGHIPARVLSQIPKYRDIAVEEVSKKLRQLAYQQLFTQIDWNPLSVSEPEKDQIEYDQPYRFVVVFEVRPTLNLQQVLDHLTLDLEVITISEQDIEKVIEEKRQNLATFKPVEREIQEGDHVKAEYYNLATANPSEAEPTPVPVEFVVGKQQISETIEQAMLGAKVGESRDVSLQPPQETVSPDPQTQAPAVFRIKVNEILESYLPSLDDEFAKDAGYDTLQQMREQIREELQVREDQQSKQLAHETLLKQIVQALEIPIPPRLLARHKQHKLQRLQSLFAQFGQGSSFIDEQFSMIEEDAKRDLCNEFVLQQVIEEQNITVSSSDLDAKYAEIAARRNRPVAAIKSGLSEEQKDSIKEDVKQEKALAYLFDCIKKNHIPVSSSERRERLQKEQEAENARYLAHNHSHSHDHDHDHHHDCDHDHDHHHDHHHDHDHDHHHDCDHDHNHHHDHHHDCDHDHDHGHQHR